MSRSSGRGQVEPTAALVVLLAVTAAVSTYAIALDGAVRGGKRDIAEPTLDRVVGTLVTGGVVDPERRRRAHRSGPSGYRLNLTVAAGGRRWYAGPAPPAGAASDGASRPVGVRLSPGRVRAGRVAVEVWT
ncbi:hypothetical protein ACFR97_07515 [Haloplanus litoreus]|uniref:Uncharacterized protein n=1 Tax=Haloplanus litoreus TaxID=767515 RepID=A0ABD6A0Z9_9EURY